MDRFSLPSRVALIFLTLVASVRSDDDDDGDDDDDDEDGNGGSDGGVDRAEFERDHTNRSDGSDDLIDYSDESFDDYDDDEEGEEEEEQDDDDEQDDEQLEENGTSDNVCEKRDRRRRKRRLKGCNSEHCERRLSCCKCEPLVSRIDFDGQPVTDVDLVTYKDLCQMEQQVQHFRATTSSRVNRRDRKSHQNNLENKLDAQSARVPLSSLQINETNKKTSGSSHHHKACIRRSSLQEESGAYYELCTSNEEQLIRSTYLWYPPSLKHLSLVEQFFDSFPKEKVPLLTKQSSTDSGNQSSSLNKQEQHQTTTTGSGSKNHQFGATLSYGGYRDEQISSQLPRQDISLDYCSYPLNEPARLAYQQFVDKRNTQALEVGTVVQVKGNNTLNYNPAATISSTSTKEMQNSMRNPPEGAHHRRKASTASCQAVTAAVSLAPNQQTRQVERLVQGRQASIAGGAQRCRRCLVRFEPEQLAVVAPNFIIGGALFPRQQPNLIAPSSAGSTILEGQTQTGIGQLLLSRRASSTMVPSIGSLVPSRQMSSHSHQITENTDSQAPTTPINNLALFHPSCFTCSTCKEFLIDLVYCLRENRLYCLRHYGESLRPRCSWCKELIFSDEYLKAMNEGFHVDHFLCRHCDSNLAGQRYVLKDEKPFCIKCYEGNFANTCEDCSKPIGIDSRDLSYKDRHWHDTCFLCNKCQQSLIDKPFGSKADKVYCADCYDDTFATRCDGCQNPFRAGSKKMEYRGRNWHDSCFCCCICQNTIGSNSFIPKNDEIYCVKCYEDKYATRCTKCKQVIVSGGVTFRNEPWHRDCFNCCNCNKSLAGQRFTTRDVTKDDETVKDINKTNQPHNAYCIECYGDLFAKKCFSCSQPITGLGGTRFVTFEDRSWHNDCFVCNDCSTSLVGKGFITDGPETILCSECARAKLR